MTQQQAPAQAAQETEETTAGGFVDELVVIRRIRKELAGADPTARSRILSYVVQKEQDDNAATHRQALDRLNGAVATKGYAGDSQIHG